MRGCSFGVFVRETLRRLLRRMRRLRSWHRFLTRYSAQWFPEGGEWPRYVVGTPARVRGQLSEMSEALGVDEIMVVTIVYEHAARVRSYELLSEAFQSARSVPTLTGAYSV